MLGLARAPRDEIDDAAERRRPVQRRRGALDDLDLAEIERRHLQQAQRIPAGPVERQPVGEQLRVAAAQPLNPDVGRTQRRRRRLYTQPGGLAEQHRDRPGRHQRLLLDLLAIDHLDAQRLVLQPPIRARRGHDNALFDLGRLLAVRRRRRGLGRLIRRSRRRWLCEHDQRRQDPAQHAQLDQ